MERASFHVEQPSPLALGGGGIPSVCVTWGMWLATLSANLISSNLTSSASDHVNLTFTWPRSCWLKILSKVPHSCWTQQNKTKQNAKSDDLIKIYFYLFHPPNPLWIWATLQCNCLWCGDSWIQAAMILLFPKSTWVPLGSHARWREIPENNKGAFHCLGPKVTDLTFFTIYCPETIHMTSANSKVSRNGIVLVPGKKK